MGGWMDGWHGEGKGEEGKGGAGAAPSARRLSPTVRCQPQRAALPWRQQRRGAGRGRCAAEDEQIRRVAGCKGGVGGEQLIHNCNACAVPLDQDFSCAVLLKRQELQRLQASSALQRCLAP
eukprot:360600-Chlamydomonas_euryale.AAC.11